MGRGATLYFQFRCGLSLRPLLLLEEDISYTCWYGSVISNKSYVSIILVFLTVFKWSLISLSDWQLFALMYRRSDFIRVGCITSEH